MRRGAYLLSVTARDALERRSVNRATKAAFAINTNERSELFSLRRKMLEVDEFLRKKGISLLDMEKESIRCDNQFNDAINGSARFITGRDEFGLPIFANGEPKVKPVHHVFDKVASPVRDSRKGDKVGISGAKDANGVERDSEDQFPPLPSSKNTKERCVEDVGLPPLKPLWSKVVSDPSPTKRAVSFDYCPRPEGTSVVSPPVEVLKEGNDKFKFCIVGTFSKGTKPFNTVVGFARTAWEKRGLLNVFQKDSHVFLFKFCSEETMNKALAQGTWYIEGQPMLLKSWKRSADAVDSIPLWVKFSKIPDCYWTQKGLSWLGSSIGRPLCVDDLTSKLEVLPFAKICVEYKIGDDLPDTIQVQSLDPVMEEMVEVEVLVHYPFKPLVCSGCRSLGHKVGACPKTKRVWVLKGKQACPNAQQPIHVDHQDISTAMKDNAKEDEVPAERAAVVNLYVTVEGSESESIMLANAALDAPNLVTSHSCMDVSPPVNAFKNLKNVDEIDLKRATIEVVLGAVLQKLSKSQKKRRRKAQGSPSS